MNRTFMQLIFTISIYLFGFTPSSHATTLFGINFDFQDPSGADVGGAFLQFDVDPTVLPFNEWIDLNTVTGFEMNAWISGPDFLPSVTTRWAFTEKDLVGTLPSIKVTDLGPVFAADVVGFFEMVYRDPFSINSYNLAFTGFSGQYFQAIQPYPPYVLQFNTIAGGWVNGDIPPTVVPLPPAAWLFGSGLLGLIGVAKRKVRA